MAPKAGTSYILQLLGLPAQTDRLAGLRSEALSAWTFEILRQMTLDSGRRQPRLLAVEDLS